MPSSSCTSEATQSSPASPARAPSRPASPPPVDGMLQGVPWPNAVRTVVRRAVAVAVAVPHVASAISTITCPEPLVTASTSSTVVVAVLVQSTAFLEPAVRSVVIDSVIDAFVVFLGWDSAMVADLKGVSPPEWAVPFECAALPPRFVRAIFDRATTYVALLLAGASRDLMSTVKRTRGGAPLSAWRLDLPDLEDAVKRASVVDESTHDVIIKATNAAANAASTVASSPFDIAKAAAAISATLNGYNTATAAASSASYTVSLVEQAAAELRNGVVVVGVNYLVNVDDSMNEALDIATRRAAYFSDFATKCMQAARLLSRYLEAEVSP